LIFFRVLCKKSIRGFRANLINKNTRIPKLTHNMILSQIFRPELWPPSAIVMWGNKRVHMTAVIMASMSEHPVLLFNFKLKSSSRSPSALPLPLFGSPHPISTAAPFLFPDSPQHRPRIAGSPPGFGRHP